MKKIILSLGLLAGMSATVQAQATFGVKAGISYTNLVGDGIDNADSKLGFHGGLTANLKLSEALAVQPELLYSMRGAQYEKNSDFKIKTNYLDLPVLLQYRLDGLFVEAGPQLGLLVSARQKFGSSEEDVNDKFNTFDLGYVLGLGYALASGPQLGLRYNGGITSVLNSNSDSARNSAFQLYVGYMFGGK